MTLSVAVLNFKERISKLSSIDSRLLACVQMFELFTNSLAILVLCPSECLDGRVLLQSCNHIVAKFAHLLLEILAC